MLKGVFFAGVFFLSSFVYADTRSDNLDRIMKAQGAFQSLEQQKIDARVESEKYGQKILNMFSSEIKPNELIKKKFSDAFLRYLKNTESPVTSQEMLSLWSKYYSEHLTDKDLSDLADFYESGLSQKENTARQKASVQFAEHLNQSSQDLFEKATKDLIEDMKKAVKECNCPKK